MGRTKPCGYQWRNARLVANVCALLREAAEALAGRGEPATTELPDDATNLEVIQFFIHVGRTMKPIGHWPGERLYAAIERHLSTPARFIAESDKSPRREHNGRGGDEDPALPPPRAGGGEVGEARFNDDGSLDEVVGTGGFHLEQMDTNYWWMKLGPHMVSLRAKGKITAHFGENEAALHGAGVRSVESDG